MKVFGLALLTSSMLAPVLALAAPLAPTALPTGASVVAGQATVGQSGSSLLVTEISNKAIINWQSFNIGAAGSVTFAQPSAGSIVLNRVLGVSPSLIDGALHANGQVVLINPNGLVFGAGSTVEVGGIIASSLDISNADFLRGNLQFNRIGSGAGVVNNGSIRAANGGYVAMLGSQLANRGLIQANFGTVALAAGDRVTMTLVGQGLVGVSVDPAAVKTQIDQGGAIVAGDGGVWLTAKAESSLLGGAINASGSIEANSLTAKGGDIVLDATGPITLAAANFSAAGATGGGLIRIGGLDNAATSIGQGSVLDVSATVSGNGGSMETSGQTLSIGDATIRAAGAGGGSAGSWLLDPYDLTIDQTAAGVIDNALIGADVLIKTSANSSTGAGVANPSGVGDIIVASPIGWATNTTLTLDAYHGVTIDAAVAASGAGAGLVLTTNDGGAGGQLTVNAPVTMPATGSVTINSLAYTLIDSVGGLQAIGSGGNYALVGNVDLSATSGFAPLDEAGFTGAFEGLGNTISGLTISASKAVDVGLIGLIGAGGLVENLVMTGASVSQGAASGGNGQSGVGILAGENDGAVYNVSTAGSVVADFVTTTGVIPSFGGGLVGLNTGTIDQGSSSATVTGSVINSMLGNINGGLVGANYGGQISNSFATGSVTGGPAGAGGLINLGGYAGGLVGENGENGDTDGIITNSFATGTVTGGSGAGNAFVGGGGDAGGLVGQNDGEVSSSYATGAAIGGASTGAGDAGAAGGLVGYNSDEISNSYSTGSATGGSGKNKGTGGFAGGLVGFNGDTITDSYATGAVTGGKGAGVAGANLTGGLVGGSNAGPTSVSGSYWDITTTGQATDLNAGATGLTTVQWLTEGPGVPGSTSGWDFTGTWLQGYPYPVLRGLAYIVVNASAAGTYGGALSVDQGGVTATDQNGDDALGLIDIDGISVIGGSTDAVTTLSGLGGAGVTVNAPNHYQIAYAPISATVDPATLTYSVANAGSTYGTLATPGAATLQGFIGDDASSVVGTVGVNDGVNPVTLAANTSAGDYNETVTGLTGAKASDYVIASTGNADGVLVISPLAVTLTGSRTYDGSSTIAGAALSASNLVGDDSLTIGGSAGLAGKDAGPEAISSTSGLTLSNTNYTLVDATGSVTINPLAVTLTGSRSYDGSTTIAGSALSASNLIGDDSLTIGGSAGLAGKDAGPEAITSTSGLTLSNTNYTLVDATGSVTINPLAVTLTGSRTYDGSTTIAGSALSASNLIGDDSLTIGGSAGLAGKNAGDEAINSTSGLTLSNTNYTLVDATGSVTINPLAVTLTGSRAYDGSATIAGSALSASNLIGDDSLTLGGSADLSGKNAGAEAITSTSGLTLSNTNYTVVGATGSVTIDPLAVTLIGSRTYDGSATIAGSALSASNLIGDDSLTIGGSAALAGKDAGPEAITSTSGLTLSNTNYTLVDATGSVTINPLALTLTGSRTYDGSAVIAGSALSASNLIGDDSLTIGGDAGLAGKDAGSEAITSTSGLTVSNTNYTVVGATGSVTIDPLAVTLTGSRTYDGSATIAGSALSASNLIGGDSLAIGGSADLAGKNAGGEAITSTSGLTLSNTNYTLVGATGAVTVDPAQLTITANSVSIGPGAVLPALSVSYSGFVDGETDSLVQGLEITADATSQSPPGAYAIVPSDAVAANYDVVFVDGVLTIGGGGASGLTGQVLASTQTTTNLGSQTSCAAGAGGGSGGAGTIALPGADGGCPAILMISDQPIGGGPTQGASMP